MNEKKEVPRCPYCGGEMEQKKPLDWIIYWKCESCGATAPICENAEGAYNAAMRRYEGANRVLSLAEIESRAGERVCMEDTDEDGDLRFRVQPVTRWERESHRMYFNSGRTWFDTHYYLSMWRCWLREPMRDESDAEKWMPYPDDAPKEDENDDK